MKIPGDNLFALVVFSIVVCTYTPGRGWVRFNGTRLAENKDLCCLLMERRGKNGYFFDDSRKVLWTAQVCSTTVLCGNSDEQTVGRQSKQFCLQISMTAYIHNTMCKIDSQRKAAV